MINWINFRGISSNTFPSILVEQIQPVQRAYHRHDQIIIPGRSGALHVDYGAYDPIEIIVTIGLRSMTRINDVLAWLDGPGSLVTSKSPDVSYKAYIYTGLTPERLGTFARFDAVFSAQPFRYAHPAPGDIVLDEPGTITNPGTVGAAPVITVVGEGDISLTIGNQIVQLYGLTDGITIDSDAMITLWDGQGMDNHMAGDFPILPPGETAISWTGDVDTVTIRPGWRYL